MSYKFLPSTEEELHKSTKMVKVHEIYNNFKQFKYQSPTQSWAGLNTSHCIIKESAVDYLTYIYI